MQENLKLISIFSDEIVDNDDVVQDIIEFCKEAAGANENASENMSVDDWKNKGETLMYLLLIEKRFSKNKGRLDLLYNEDKIIALSGVYISDFDPLVAIGAVRGWILKEYRHTWYLGKYVFPTQCDWAQKQGAKIFLMTFNDYNLPIAKMFERSANGRGVIGIKTGHFYKGMELHPKPLLIKNIFQWALKKTLEKGFEWDPSDLEKT